MSMAVEGIQAIYQDCRQLQVVSRLLPQKEAASCRVGPSSPSCWKYTLCLFAINYVFKTII